ncbi:mucin-2-like [Melitaea cinxia]|uniref:mucin-2-like n=1 Tax=Melitaea cinxia TaxID=113334 RepID=UPI001E272AB6|nr:mucin-2-like [Melitaea cinxia]
MIIPKLLLLLPLLLLAEAQNDSQRVWSNRLPLRRPVITPGFGPESTLSPTTNNPITTKQIPEFVTQQYVPTSSKNYEEVTTKGAEIASVSSFTSETRAPNRGKVGFTIIFSNSYTENPITTSSISPPLSLTPQRPIQRPFWSRPINRPENSQPITSNITPLASTVESSPSTAETSTLIVAPSTSPVASTIIAAEPITSTAAPSISTVTPSSLNIANVEGAAKIPPENQEPGDRRPGFTIIFSDNYTKKPMTINTSPVSVAVPSISTVTDSEITAKIPPASQDSEDRRPGYTIIFSNNNTKNPTTVNSSPAVPLTSIVASPSTSTFTPSTLTVTNVEAAAKIPAANQESKDRKPGYTVIFTDSSTKKPTTIVSPSVFTVTRQPIQNPVQTNPTTFTPTSIVNQNTGSYIPTQTTNLPSKKPTESYSIIIINNNGSDPNISSQKIANPPKESSDTTGPSQNITITEVKPVTNQIVMPTIPTAYTSTTSRPIPVRPFPSRPIPFRPTSSIPTTSTPLIVVVPSKAPAPVTNTPVTTSPWRTTTTSITTLTTTWKPPTTWTTSTSSNPQKPWNSPTQSGGQQRPLQPNVINQLQDYICRDVNGYYLLENKCDEYILCKNNTAYKNMCPDGLHFNPVARYPAYPCAYPTEVKCQIPSIKQPAQPTSECPHRFGHFPVPNGDCGHFMMCQEGVATIMACPPGLAFNTKISACDWSVNVPGCNPSAFKGFTCPAVKTDTYENSAIINYRYKNSCKNYIACHEGHPRLLSCDAGLSFDEAAAKCVESSLVKNCTS